MPSPELGYLRPASSMSSPDLMLGVPSRRSQAFPPMLSRVEARPRTVRGIGPQSGAVGLVFQQSKSWNEPPHVFRKYADISTRTGNRPAVPVLRWRE